jgi:DNA-directed RNA polymerase specialized sigma24 family protein
VSTIAVERIASRPARELLVALRSLSDSDANLVLLASQKGISYRDIAEAWGVAPVVIARRLRVALLRMREAAQGTAAPS